MIKITGEGNSLWAGGLAIGVVIAIVVPSLAFEYGKEVPLGPMATTIISCVAVLVGGTISLMSAIVGATLNIKIDGIPGLEWNSGPGESEYSGALNFEAQSKKLAGLYRQKDDLDFWHLENQAGLLAGKAPWGRFKMIPTAKNTYKVQGWEQSEFRFETDKKGGPKGFKEMKHGVLSKEFFFSPAPK